MTPTCSSLISLRGLKNRLQLTSDGHKAYLEAVEDAFGCDVDYAMLVKLYGKDQREDDRHTAAPVCMGCTSQIVSGDPDPAHISTSFAERHNWTVRTNVRRYTRLSNGFSRKFQDHAAAVALNYFAYNFVRIHRTLRVTPAMAAGVINRLMDVSDLVGLLEEEERKRKKPLESEWTMVSSEISGVINEARPMKIAICDDGGHRTMKSILVAVIVGFCFLANVPICAGDSSFVNAIGQAKQFVVPIVCFGENPDTKAPYLISVVGTGFFVSGDARVITAGHVGKVILAKSGIPSCAFPAIYVPVEGWDSSSSSVKIQYVSIINCLIGDSLDIAACDLAEDLTKDQAIKTQPTASTLDVSIYPDGTPVAFTGFPLSFVQPITSQGIIGTYKDVNAALGPTELVVDKSAWPGASGSPVFQIDGRVVGMIIQAGFNEASGLAFAIPGAVIKKFLSDNPPTKKQDRKN